MILIYFLIFFITCSAMGVVLSRNPIYSVLSLIGVFFFSFFFLMALDLEFYALIFLIIYIGAIAVLFVFVIMMLNINIIERYEYTSIWPFSLLLFFSLFFVYLYPRNFYSILLSIDNYEKLKNIIEKQHNNFFEQLDSKIFISKLTTSLLREIGVELYNVQYINVVVGGIILLVALVCAVDIITSFRQYTLQDKRKVQKLYQQVNRTISESVFTIKNEK